MTIANPWPDRNVVAWLDEQLAETLYVSTVSLAAGLRVLDPWAS